MNMNARHFLPVLGVCAVVLMGQATVPATMPATAPGRLAVPPAGKRDEALGLIQKLFADEYARKKPEDRAALGRRLLKEAAGTHDDAAARYELLEQAAALAAEGGDPETMCAAADMLAGMYEVDGFAKRITLLKICANTVTGAAIDREVALAFAAMDAAVARKDFVAAAQMAEAAEWAAGRAQSVAYSASIQPRLRDFRSLMAESKLAQAAAKTLEKADDPAAHLIVGRFEALGVGDFATGLPHLVKGGDAALAAAARADLANPAGTDEQVKLGDMWWAIGEAQSDHHRIQAAARARYWYGLAKQTITGITLTKINSRLAEATTASAAPGAGHLDLLPLVDVEKDAVAGTWKVDGGDLVITPDKYNRLQLPVRPPEEYDFTVRFTRTEVNKGNEGTVAIMLTYKDKPFDLALQASGNAARLEAVNKNAVKDNPTIVPLKLENNQPYTVTVEVRKDGVRALLDGKMLLEYKTDYKDLSGYASWKLKDTSLLGVGANSAGVRFEKIELVPVTGQPRVMRGGN